MIDPLQALLETALKTNQFSPTSRYSNIETATHETVEGKIVVHLRRRFLPSADKFTVLQEHMVQEGERLDQLATQYMSDPEQFWRICDANDATQPEELTDQPGQTINITLPEGVTGF